MKPLDELATVAKEMTPPPGLEDRVVGALRGQSLLGTRSTAWGWQAAAALFLLGTGVLFGRFSAPAPDLDTAVSRSSMPRFLLMLTDGEDDSGDDVERSARYRQWVIDQRSAGRAITGERLAPSGLAVVRSGSGPVLTPDVQGYFVISAASIDDAASVARSSPHVQSGGMIIVRPIDTP